MIMSSNKTHDIACYFHISQDFKRYIAQQEGLPFKYGKSKKSLSVDHFASILRRAFLVSTCFANDSEKAINNCSKKQKLKLAKKKKIVAKAKFMVVFRKRGFHMHKILCKKLHGVLENYHSEIKMPKKKSTLICSRSKMAKVIC